MYFKILNAEVTNFVKYKNLMKQINNMTGETSLKTKRSY